MGKKRKEDGGQETYEVWIYKDSGEWAQAAERGNQGIFGQKPRALLIAQSKSNEEGVVETLVIERRPIASFNGPSISLKGRLAAAVAKANQNGETTPPASGEGEAEKKKEETHADGVHGDRAEEGQVVDSGPQREGEAGAPGPQREAASGR